MASNKIDMRIKKDIPQSLDEYASFYGMDLNDEQKAFRDAIWNPDNDVVMCNAKAGTGKTTIAIGVANLLVKYGFFKEIIYIVSPTQEEKQGYLPGTQEEKNAPYMEPLYEALVKIGENPNLLVVQGDDEGSKYGGYVRCMTHTYTRGVNFENAVIVCDESQNYFGDELKKVLTRICANCKTIVIGHTGQCDLYKHPEKSGFSKYLEHFRGHDHAEICELNQNYRGWVSQWADMLEF